MPKDSKILEADKDLVIKHNFIPLVEEADKPEFRDVYNEIDAENINGERLQKLQSRLALSTELKPHAQKYLLSKALAKSKKEDHL